MKKKRYFLQLFGLLFGAILLLNIPFLQAQNFEEIFKVVSSNPQEEGRFGTSVSISGDFAIVGEPALTFPASSTGAAYIFERQNGAWVEVANFQGNNQIGAGFGISVSISGNIAIVGAFRESFKGAIYIYERQNGVWTQVNRIEATTFNTEFGRSLMLVGDIAIVGAPDENIGANNSVGAAYIVTPKNGDWSDTESTRIESPNPQQFYEFGSSVAISGNLVLVGEPGPPLSNFAGAAYLFEYQNGAWNLIQTLQATNPQMGAQFGNSVSISGDVVLVGAFRENILGNNNAGAAYIFTPQNGNWTNFQTTKIQAPIPQSFAGFGRSVSLFNNLAFVGSSTANQGAGATYIYKKENGTWTELSEIEASDKQTNAFFGNSLFTDGNTVIIGADATDNAGVNAAGTAYFFAPACELTAVTPTVPTCSGGNTNFQVAFEGLSLSATQTVVVEANALGLTAGQVLATGSSSPISVSLPNQPNPGTLMLRLQDAGNAACSTTFSVNLPGCVPPIPTMGEWALIFMGLFLLTLFSAYVTVPALSTSSAKSSSTFHFQKLPFDLQGYLKSWLMVVCGILLFITIAILGFGYELTTADPMGAILCSFTAAYWVYLMIGQDAN